MPHTLDERHWMASHGCLLIVECTLSCWMREGLPTRLHILFDFMNSHLGFPFCVNSSKFHICANSIHLVNLTMFDVSFLKVGNMRTCIVVLLVCAHLKLHLSYFQIYPCLVYGRARHWVPTPMPMPIIAHAHGFWVGMGAI